MRKGVVQAGGFQKEILFEFLVALTLSEFHTPANISAKTIFVLRLFANEVENIVPNFQFPSSLTDADSPQISLLITNGTRLFFVLDLSKTRPIVLGGIDLSKESQDLQLTNIEVAFEYDDNFIDLDKLIHQMSGSSAFLTLNLTQTAMDLKAMLTSEA